MVVFTRQLSISDLICLHLFNSNQEQVSNIHREVPVDQSLILGPPVTISRCLIPTDHFRTGLIEDSKFPDGLLHKDQVTMLATNTTGMVKITIMAMTTVLGSRRVMEDMEACNNLHQLA